MTGLMCAALLSLARLGAVQIILIIEDSIGSGRLSVWSCLVDGKTMGWLCEAVLCAPWVETRSFQWVETVGIRRNEVLHANWPLVLLYPVAGDGKCDRF